jgi:hypothetical protein
MVVLGYICLAIMAIFAIIWLYRKISIAKNYTKTVGEIINFKNMVPLVDKKGIFIKGNYVYTECYYHGDVYVTVKFISRDGEELNRRYHASEPLYLKINEHKRSVPQYTTVFPDWQIGKRVKVFYDPADTLDIFVGKAPKKIKKNRVNQEE